MLANFDPTVTIFVLVLIILLLLVLLYLLLRGLVRWPFQPPSRFPPAEYYIQDELILTGPEELLNRLVTQVRGVQIERLERLRLSELGSRVQDCGDLPGNLVIDLYKLNGSRPDVQDAIRRLNETPGPETRQVAKDPNWITGQPFEVEGSPFEVEGSPFEVEGSGRGTQRGFALKQALDESAFMGQWAFKHIELHQDGCRGEGVRVGIFDSSPFPNVPFDIPVSKSLALPQAPSPLKLNLLHPTRPNAAAQGLASDGLSNHGLFVAGLVKAVAQETEIHLVRVLDDKNKGDLYHLIRSMYAFLKQAAVDNPPRTGTVINLSLGVRIPPPEAGFGLPTDVLALQYLVLAANCLGVVVVAAAGNNSAGVSLPLGPNLPANIAPVVGVAASNISSRRACFSNWSEMAAPGGDGVSAASRGKAGSGCQPLNQADTSIVGPVLPQPLVDETRVAYAYWCGSSFSAPIVAGLAARVLQAGNGSLSPLDVERILRCGSTPGTDHYLGVGIINVRKTLAECAPPCDGGEAQEVEQAVDEKTEQEGSGEQLTDTGLIEVMN